MSTELSLFFLSPRSRIKILDRILAYKDTCLTGSKKQTFAVFLFSIRSLLSGYCRNLESKRTRALLSAADCLNKAVLPQLNRNCYNTAVQRLTDAQTLTDSKQKLSTMCCIYAHFLACIRDLGSTAMESSEGAGCSEQHIDTALSFVRQAFDGTISLVCGEYSEAGDQCERFRFIKAVSSGKKVKTESFRSFAAPAIRIISTI